jgi:MSHA biogenesis protein MshL
VTNDKRKTNGGLWRWCLPLLAVSLLGGCAGGPTEHPAAAAMERAVQETAPGKGKPTELPEAVSSALLPPVNINVPGKQKESVEPRFDVKVRRAPARDFFLSLVEGTSYNMVVHPDVKGTISLNLKNVTVPEVMNTVRDVYGYDYEHTATGYEVFPNTLRTKLFQVNYLDFKRKGESKMQANPGEISTSGYNGSGTGSSGTNNMSTSGTGTSGGYRRSTNVSGSSIDTESESDFWTGLAKSLRDLIGTGEGRRVSVNAQSGLVAVRAMPSELRDVAQYLKANQEAVERQVVIEARVLEVELNHAFQSGINWADLQRTYDGNAVIGQTGGGSIFGGSGVSGIAGNSGDLSPTSPSAIDGTAASAFGGVFTLAVNTGHFNAFIELLKTQGNVQVLSRPRVSTVNNQKAVIKVGSDEFFVTDVDTSTTTGTATSQTASVQLTPFFSGVTLDVTPQISAAGDIILHVHPAVSEVREQTKNISVSTSADLTIPLAASTIRESDSVIRARSGQVVVIGGLMRNRVSDENASVPVLGDLPLVGKLFQHTRKQKSKSELVILLKPTVVRGDRQWAQEVRRSAGTFRELEQSGKE